MDTSRRKNSPALRTALALGLLAAPLLLAGCDDPSCVFGGNCFGTAVPGGSIGAAAFAPIDGERILAAEPMIEAAAPDGAGDRHPDTPVAIVFSETMVPSSVLGAFQIVDVMTDLPLPSRTNLVGDGRVLVLRPDDPIPTGSYAVRAATGAAPLDLTGQGIADLEDDLATFDVVDEAAAPDEPQVVLLHPLDGTLNESPTAEMVLLFDREVSPPADLDLGFDVKVTEAGSMTPADPAFDPDVEPLVELIGLFPVPTPDTRLWTWRSVSGEVEQRLVRSGGTVTVTVSPAAARFVETADMMQVVQEVTSTFTVSLAPRPLAGLVNPGKLPQDAIGIANLDGMSMADALEVQVEYETDDQAMDGDLLTVLFFGTDPSDPANTIAFSRTVTLSGMGPIANTTLDLADLDFTSSTAPLLARVADGSVRFALQLTRGGEEGPLRVLDTDLLTDGIQDPVLDTVRPELLLLESQATLADEFRGDVVDLTVVGHADVGAGDFVRGALATTVMMGDNTGMMAGVPDVLGSAPSVVDAGSGPVASSLFLAAPIPVGRFPALSGTVDFTLTVFDRALNATETSLTLPYRQLGAVGDTPIDPADSSPLVVEVYDAETLEPIQGALVYSHARTDDGMGGFIFPSIAGSPVTTDANGIANTVPHHNITQLATLVTVVAGGYDVVTFDGLPSTRISIPLQASPEVLVTASGSVVADSGVDVSALVRRVADTRRDEPVQVVVPTLNVPGGTEFDFDADSIRPARFGVQAFLAGVLDANIANVSKDRLLKAFALRVPVAGQLVPLSVVPGALSVTGLLDDPAGPADEIAQAVTEVQLDAVGVVGMDPEDLEDDFHYGTQPIVQVEGLLAGVDRPLPVGLGTAYDTANPRIWDLRSAFAGAVAPANPASIFDPELRLRVELRQDDPAASLPAAVSGLRPDLADLAGLAPLLAPDAAQVTSIPTDGTGTIDDLFLDVGFDDVIDDSTGLLLDGRGIYRVTLTEDLGGTPGRSWTAYRLDAAGAATATVHFPDLTPDPTPLQTGPMASTTIRISAFAWETFPIFDPMDAEEDVFLWSDLQREVEAYSHSLPVVFTLM